MIVRLYTNTSELLEKKRIEAKRRMGIILIYIAMKAYVKRKGIEYETRIRRHIKSNITFVGQVAIDNC